VVARSRQAQCIEEANRMTARKPTRSRCVALMAAVAALVACTGCAMRPTTAFTVGDMSVSNDQVTRMAQSCVTSINTDATANLVTLNDVEPTTVQFQLFATIGDAIATKTGLTFADADREQYLNAVPIGPLLMRDDLCKQMMYDYATLVLLQYQLGSDEFANQVKGLDITVNPRYGDVDVDSILSGHAALVGSGSLSTLDQGH
jgi:hypothetical protein